MAATVRPLRRKLALAGCAVVVTLLTLLMLSMPPTLKMDTVSGISRHDSAGKTGPGSGHKQRRKTAQLHYLIPASRPNVELCYNLVSSAVTRYPVPTMLGFNGTAELDAGMTHLAKLRALKRHLDSLPPQDDDDLVLVVDGYDVIQQLPPDVVIERYFDLADAADARLAERLGLSVDEARRRNLRQTIFWGPDKFCFPFDPTAPRCWLAPPSPLGPQAFGPNPGNGDGRFNDPRWLNLGTVVGPLGDFKRLIHVVDAEVAATHDASFEFRESDQYYIANVWARQEYWQSKLAVHGAHVEGGPPDRVVPAWKTGDPELHVAVDSESVLFQTRAAYEPFLEYLEFGGSDLTATIHVDRMELGDSFEPFTMRMLDNVAAALTQLYDAVPDAHPGTAARDWIRTVRLGVNLVSRHIYGLWHCTGDKTVREAEYRRLWWYPFAESMLKAAVKASRAGDAISTRPIDGRKWVPKRRYPDGRTLAGKYGGAWSDDNGRFVPWSELCGQHEESLFRGQRGSAPPAKRAEVPSW